MGQKVNPQGIRIGITSDWKSRWFSKKDFPRTAQRGYQNPRIYFQAAQKCRGWKRGSGKIRRLR